VESPSLEIFQPRLDAVLCSLLWVTLLGQGGGLGDPQRSLPTPPCWDSGILWPHQRPRCAGQGERWCFSFVSARLTMPDPSSACPGTPSSSLQARLGALAARVIWCGTLAFTSLLRTPPSFCPLYWKYWRKNQRGISEPAFAGPWGYQSKSRRDSQRRCSTSTHSAASPRHAPARGGPPQSRNLIQLGNYLCKHLNSPRKDWK